MNRQVTCTNSPKFTEPTFAPAPIQKSSPIVYQLLPRYNFLLIIGVSFGHVQPLKQFKQLQLNLAFLFTPHNPN